MRAATLMMAFALTVGAAQAADEAGRDAARATVTRQIEAFRKDDAATAYAQAAPVIQGMFPSADTFLAMVRKGYAAVYRARTYSVDRVEDVGPEGVALGVKLQDEAGADWLALYTLEKQPDGAWRITGCQLTKAPGTDA
ncbi:topoisomerase II [Methylobacterium sp. Leaf99]|uniref:DUF4864 domain-containing protein n=1 Tax=unclassified Methylobacterium TaxID=2615210 RepID=UPI0006F9A254|nr:MULTISPECIES: DUF4864 domain-containing protein [unclassified Methylobacterium]KQP09918.1 topoisomerase II [Methylobacterium sp. Leaf99]TXM74697.1 DUF4864 domain-containing protein [Methylobacterium sp. WL69]